MDDPVQEMNVSPPTDYKISTAGAPTQSQQVYLGSILILRKPARLHGGRPRSSPLWQSGLDRMQGRSLSVASDVEWVGKYRSSSARKSVV